MEFGGLVGYLIFFASMVSIYGVLTLALNIQWGMTGQINIGVAGFYAIGAYTTAILTTDPSPNYLGGFGLPFYVGFIAAMAISGALGLVIGWITVRLRTDYLAIATIGIAEIIRFVVKNEGEITHGVRGIAEIPNPIVEQGSATAPVFLLVALTCLAGVYFLIERARVSPWGRVLRAVRDNEDATLAAGKNVVRFRLQAFIVGSAFMGLAGALYAHFIGFISPEAFRPVFGTFIIWTMLIAGGSGNNKGALLGVFIVWLIWSGTELLTGLLPPDWAAQAGAARVLLIGVLLEIILLTRPQGLLPETRPKLPTKEGG